MYFSVGHPVEIPILWIYFKKTVKISFKHSKNTTETPFKHPCNSLETNWNTSEAFSKNIVTHNMTPVDSNWLPYYPPLIPFRFFDAPIACWTKKNSTEKTHIVKQLKLRFCIYCIYLRYLRNFKYLNYCNYIVLYLNHLKLAFQLRLTHPYNIYWSKNLLWTEFVTNLPTHPQI